MTFIILATVAFFLIMNLLINYALFRLFTEKTKTAASKVLFSVVVAARNESINIEKLINSLSGQNYPRDGYEVVLVDDGSEDCTYEIIREQIKDKSNFRVIKAENKPFAAKKGALAIGISRTKNPFIIITDADCEPGKDWLMSYSEKFNEGFELLFGIYTFNNTGTFVNAVSRFNGLRSALLTFSAAFFRKPYCAGASSFAFKKEAFDSFGGYKNTQETLSGDDDLLIREAVKKGYRIGTVTSPGAIVRTSSKETVKDYLVQKARHTSTSNHYLPVHKTFLAIWHLLNILFLFSPILYFISPYFILPLILKMATDLITVRLQQRRFGCSFRFSEIFYLQALYEVLLIINYLNAASGRKISWK